jgi:hypothetical protein
MRILQYVQWMLRIAIVSSEKHWANQVAAIFPDWEMHLEQLEQPSTVLLSGTARWDALVLDLDSVESHTPKVIEFIEMTVSRSRHTIVLIPPRLQQLEARFSGTGIFVLRKPISSGEIALAVRMLFREV